MKLVVLGLSLSSSWGNGHATTYRALLAAMAARGHDILFLERDQPWYAAQRDLADPPFCRLALYRSVDDLRAWAEEIASADAVIVGSYVPEGIAVVRTLRPVVRGVFAFYDIDTPVTLAGLARGEIAYLERAQIAEFDLYLSFTGGRMLRRLEEVWGARRARALYCSVDPAHYRPSGSTPIYALGYLGTYSPDRQPVLERLLMQPARRRPDLPFVVAGPQYPPEIEWPSNVARIEHLAPDEHPAFYGSLAWTLNVTRADMREAGWSPSVRLFEASACGCPIISDAWPGIEDILAPGCEVALAHSAEDVLAMLEASEPLRRRMADAARRRVLAHHSASNRAAELEQALRDCLTQELAV